MKNPDIPATAVRPTIAAIEMLIDGWNERCEPFVWTKTADEMIGKIRPQTDLRHATLGG